MIGMLKGEVVLASGSEVTVMVGGVGYVVHVPASPEAELKPGDQVTLHTHLIAREDAMSLYGFTSPQQKEIFSLLLSVSGVGPKTAMNILSGVEPGRFLEEVVSENIGYLSSLPGIGKKSAQRIVLELKERIAKRYATRGVKKSMNIGEDAVAALMALGYAETQARRAVSAVKAETVEDLIRGALKELIR
jgi:Holliday junction DNA helicase RuvA